jgi:hypothetical protein
MRFLSTFAHPSCAKIGDLKRVIAPEIQEMVSFAQTMKSTE